MLNHSEIPPTPTIIAKGDSGASNHYFRNIDSAVLTNQQAPFNPPKVYIPDGSALLPTVVGNLPLKPLSPSATQTYILNNLESSSLISLGQLCNDGCIIILDKK